MGALPGGGPAGNLCCSELVFAAQFCPVLHAGCAYAVFRTCGTSALICSGFLRIGWWKQDKLVWHFRGYDIP